MKGDRETNEDKKRQAHEDLTRAIMLRTEERRREAANRIGMTLEEYDQLNRKVGQSFRKHPLIWIASIVVIGLGGGVGLDMLGDHWREAVHTSEAQQILPGSRGSPHNAVRLYSEYPDDVSFFGGHQTQHAYCGIARGTFGYGGRRDRDYAYDGYSVAFGDSEPGQYRKLCGG